MKKNLKSLIAAAMLAAVSCVLFLVQFSTPLTPSFLKLDISDLPALLASMALGAPYGVLVCLIKNVIGLLHSQTGGVGELSNFLLSASFVLVTGLVYRRFHSRKGCVAGVLLGGITMAAVSFPSNLFLVYPVYAKFLPMEAIMGAYQLILPGVRRLWQALLIFNVPFTFVKALLCAVLALTVYLPLERVLKKILR
jgi:riboflavin transporter FmnP